jgi:hypothetical protein
MVKSEEYIIGGDVIGISLLIMGVFYKVQNSTPPISNRNVQSIRSPTNNSTRNNVNQTANIVALDDSVGGKRINKTKRKK